MFDYRAPIPGSQVRKDFLIGNGVMRAVWGFTNRAGEIELTVYVAGDTREDHPDLPARDTAEPGPFGLVIDGRMLPIPGRVDSLRAVSSAAPGRAIEFVLESEAAREIVLASWIAPDSRRLYVSVSAPRAPSAQLRFGRALAGAVVFDPDGCAVHPGEPVPRLTEGEWQFCLSWEDSARWMCRCEVVAAYESTLSNRTLVSMNNNVLAERANTVAQCLQVSRRTDGRLPAGAHRAYDGAWIRDGVMDCAGMIYAGCADVGDTLLYLLNNVPPKPGQLEENGMMVFGLHHYWAATGDSDLAREALPALEPLVHGLFREEFADLDTGLLASPTEGYWERDWLGRACELSQNAWAVVAVRLYTRMGMALGRPDDYEALRARADRLWRIACSDFGFVREGRFVKRLLPGGGHQAQGLVRRGLSMGGNPYRDQFASAADYQEAMRDLDPDVQTCTPWLWGLMEPKDPLCRATADEIWRLWNQDWDFGGLARYNVFADCDRETAGPWFLASLMAARAFALQDDYDKVSRIIGWTDREYLGCGWSERISRAHPPDDPERYVHEVLNWPAGEYLMLVYRESAGLYPTPEGLAVRPHLPPEFEGLSISGFSYRGARYDIRYHGCGGSVERIEFDGADIAADTLPTESGEVDVFLAGRS